MDERPRPALPRPSYWLALAGVTVAYVATAKLGITLPVAHGVITPVWAPTGISLAVLLLFGPRLWPAVALGAFIANGTSGAEPLVAGGIALGNTLEALGGTYLLRRAGFRTSLSRVKDVLLLVVLGAGVSTLISASVGVGVLSLTGAASYGSDWVLWWFGDAVGALMVAPLILVAFTCARQRPSSARLLEALVLLASLAGVSAAVFLTGAWRYPYLIFPLLLWATLRFRQLGAAAGAFVVGAIGTWGTIAGAVSIGVTNPTDRVQIIQALICIVAISLLVMGATLAEREAAGNKLKETAARLSEAQALTHIGSWEWEIAAGAVNWSAELYPNWGLDHARLDASYEDYLQTVHADDRDFVDVAVRGALSTGGFDYECRIVDGAGAQRVVHARGKVVNDATGAPLRILATAQDITEQKEMEGERERLLALERAQNARLRELDRMKDGFLASVSHEFRTPLTSIIGVLELLRDDRLTHDQQRCLDIGWRSTERLHRLVNDLLFVAHAGTDNLTLTLTGVDLRALALERIGTARVQAEAAGVEVVLGGTNVPVLEADEARLRQLLDNLVSNAIKFSTNGGRVEVRTEAENGSVVLEVADRGIGVPALQQQHLFDRFYRGSNASQHAIPGTGVGLSIAKTIVDAHAGSMTFESVENKGTTVRVEFPLAPHSNEAARSTPETGEVRQTAA